MTVGLSVYAQNSSNIQESDGKALVLDDGIAIDSEQDLLNEKRKGIRTSEMSSAEPPQLRKRINRVDCKPYLKKNREGRS